MNVTSKQQRRNASEARSVWRELREIKDELRALHVKVLRAMNRQAELMKQPGLNDGEGDEK